MGNAVFTPANIPPLPPGRQRYGVLGFPVAHSLSPGMQEAGFQALGIDAEYLRVEIPDGDLPAAIPQLRKTGFRGWNCTLPHKEAMFALCKETDATAKEAASVNTVVALESDLRGYSTDADGWEDAVKEAWNLDFRAQRILVLGCGGVGRTLATRLAGKGCRALVLCNRSPEKANRLAKEIQPLAKGSVGVVAWNSPEFGEAMQKTNLFIHATSLGLSSHDPLPLPETCLRPGLKIYDTVYRKEFTPLVRQARARGAEALDGLGMLLHQGARAFRIWTGKEAPLKDMRRAMEQAAGRSL
ncbi:MAG: shikimate dehydrogenase [Verrucomicrobia bacterium]|nr:shikimate dehydrogenase [Verrucomicrobiota bacterium]